MYDAYNANSIISSLVLPIPQSALTLVLPGEGPYLKVLSKTGSLLLKVECLPLRRVHGIRPGKVERLRYMLALSIQSL